MPDISQITLPSGSTYDIKDTTARSAISQLESAIAGGVHYIGATTTSLVDGSTTNPIVINGSDHTNVLGDLVNIDTAEFIWDGTKWNLLGTSTGGAFGALAYADTASGTYTPAGTVSQPTFTGTQDTVTVTGAASGTVSQPTFTGTAATVTVGPSGGEFFNGVMDYDETTGTLITNNAE